MASANAHTFHSSKEPTKKKKRIKNLARNDSALRVPHRSVKGIGGIRLKRYATCLCCTTKEGVVVADSFQRGKKKLVKTKMVFLLLLLLFLPFSFYRFR